MKSESCFETQRGLCSHAEVGDGKGKFEERKGDRKLEFQEATSLKAVLAHD